MLELIYLFTCLLAFCLCILYFSQKDLKSLFKKTLENKEEIGKRKQKRKKNRKPAPSQFTPSPRPTSALGPRKVQRPGRLRAHPFPPPWPADGRGPPVSRAPFPLPPAVFDVGSVQPFPIAKAAGSPCLFRQPTSYKVSPPKP